MKMIANHGVIYHDTLYTAGETIEVDPADAEEMMQYATAEEPAEKEPAKRKK